MQPNHKGCGKGRGADGDKVLQTEDNKFAVVHVVKNAKLRREVHIEPEEEARLARVMDLAMPDDAAFVIRKWQRAGASPAGQHRLRLLNRI